jgi:methylenetetrahydrofolate dehydrogenase (NADP+)/methenyltetrahydrofolate cyclohydrolase
MMLIDGKKIAADIRFAIKREIETLSGRKPRLALVVVGDHPASLSYVRGKKKACHEVGMISSVTELPASITEHELLEQIRLFNEDPLVDGILVQMPLPKHIREYKVTAAIDPKKDVDGFHPLNIGKLLLGEEGGFIPCTPKGIFVLLQTMQIPVKGKHVVIIGRSNIVGKPLAALLVQKKEGCNATVTLAHSQSEHLHELTRSADILVAAIGSPLLIKKEMVKPGAAIIDVGINRTKEGSLVGDVDFKKIAPIAQWITPVPGGVGPMTIAMLIQNTLEGYKKH